LLILSSSRIKIESIMRIATKGVWTLTLAVCAGFVLFTVISVDVKRTGKMNSSLRNDVLQSLVLDVPFEKIGQGPLSLSAYKKKSIIPDMSKEILVLAKNARPDRQIKDTSVLITLKSSSGSYTARSGEQIFLSCDPLAGGTAPVYHFSERKTPLWIRPTVLDKNDVLLEVGIFMPSKESETFLEEKTQFVVQDHAMSQESEGHEQAFIAVLKQAKLWGSDVLFAQYGGKEYKSWKDKQKIEIPAEKQSLFYFLEKGDLLQWKNHEWVPVTLAEASNRLPLAEVKAVSTRFLELQVWDEEGFYPTFIKLEAQPSHRSGFKTENLPHSIRLRTSSQVTCCLGKRRYILKEGDWLLKTARGWRNLKRAKDIEDYLQHRIKGELFIFDGFSREQGKLLIKGHWFDEMRTQIVPFSVPVSGDSKSRTSLRKEKKGPSLRELPKGSISFQSKPKENELKRGGDE
jgi:hypothetical protein